MSFLHALRRPPRLHACYALRRAYASKPAAEPAAAAAAEVIAEAGAEGEVVSRSACAPGTIMPGLNFLKDQPPVVALPDDQYPEWLWTLLDPPQIEDDGPGGVAEKRRLRKANRQRIRDQNFMKTQ